MASSRIDGDCYVAGSLAAQSMTLPTGSVTDTTVASGAAIQCEKAEAFLVRGTDGGIGRAGSFAAKHVDVFVAPTTCVVRAFRATLAGACTTGTAGFDLNINGTSALSGHVTFTSSDGNGDVKTGTLSTTTLAADDVVSIQYTVDAGSPDGTGPWAQVEIDMVPT